MKNILRVFSFSFLCFILFTGYAYSDTTEASGNNTAQQIRNLNWQIGPANESIDGKATFSLPNQYMLLQPGDADKFNELIQNPTGNARIYIFAPSDIHWFAKLNTVEDGYVKDDEKIDADAVLAHIRQSTEQANEIRRQRGWPTLTVLGWRYPPYYDSQTKRLEWAVEGQDSNGIKVINFNTRILGRTGVTSATLITSPENLDQAVTEFKQTLNGFDYNSGERYSDFRQGDKVAEYGLAGLIVGGAAAAAVKAGGFKALGKLIWVAILGFFGFIGGILKKIGSIFSGKKNNS